jgi:phosphoglycerate dehydrogenase-like enzyme
MESCPVPAVTQGRPVLVVDDQVPLAAGQVTRIRQLASGMEVLRGISKTHLRRAHVVYTSTAPFDPADAPCLHWVQTNNVAVNHLRGTPVARSGVPIANVRGAYAIAVAECAIGLMLALTRRLHICRSMQLQRRWPEDKRVLMGENCHGRTLGIVGYGSAGRHVARIAHAIGMKVLAYKRRPDIKPEMMTFSLPGAGDAEGEIPDAWFGPGQLAQMLRPSDVAIVTLPLTDSTRRLLGKSELDALSGRKYILNVGRGGVIDETALTDALRSGTLAGAGLDVFASEPLPADSPLWQLSNVIILPHIASYTEEQAYLAAEVLIENLTRFLSSRPLVNLVNMQHGY